MAEYNEELRDAVHVEAAETEELADLMFARTLQEEEDRALAATLRDEMISDMAALSTATTSETTSTATAATTAPAAAPAKASPKLRTSNSYRIFDTITGAFRSLVTSSSGSPTGSPRGGASSRQQKEQRARSHSTSVAVACSSAKRGYTAQLIESLQDVEVDCVNGAGHTPLYLAVASGREDATRLLLERGADANYRCTKGGTPLHAAARANALTEAKLLLEHGRAHIFVTDELGDSPLHVAIRLSHAPMVRLLLTQAADAPQAVNMPTTVSGDTPLHVAVAGGHVDLVCLLLYHNANPNLRNARGETAHYMVTALSSSSSNAEMRRFWADFALGAEPLAIEATSSDTCSFRLCGKEMVRQWYFQCVTCKLVSTLGCCTACARICHASHELEGPFFNAFYCDCGAHERKYKCRSLGHDPSSTSSTTPGDATPTQPLLSLSASSGVVTTPPHASAPPAEQHLRAVLASLALDDMLPTLLQHHVNDVPTLMLLSPDDLSEMFPFGIGLRRRLWQYIARSKASEQRRTHLMQNVLPIRKISTGSFGIVYEAMWDGATRVAMKRLLHTHGGGGASSSGGRSALPPSDDALNVSGDAIETDDDAMLREFDNEISLLSKLRHPNILPYLGVAVFEQAYYIVTEFFAHGNLSSLLRRQEANEPSPIRITSYELLLMSMDVAAGMGYLAAHGIIHRDLAARNMLCARHDANRIMLRVADFGLSRAALEGEYSSRKRRLPVRWTAPEGLRHGRWLVRASDVWSFGVLLHEMFNLGRLPYGDMSNHEVYKHVLAGGRLPRPDACPTAVYALMQRAFAADPDERPTFDWLHAKLNDIALEETGGVDPSFATSGAIAAESSARLFEAAKLDSELPLVDNVEYYADLDDQDEN